MFHKYFNPVKKLFVFRFAFLTKVSVISCNSLLYSGVPTDTPVAGVSVGDGISLLQFDKKLSPKLQKIITGMINFFHTYEKIIWAVPNSSFQGSKLQFVQRKTPDCKAPIKMSQPCNRKILFVQFEKCMYAIPKPPFSASPNLTFCYRYCQFTDIMLHLAPPTPRNVK